VQHHPCFELEQLNRRSFRLPPPEPLGFPDLTKKTNTMRNKNDDGAFKVEDSSRLNEAD
jgi:hypothetical protein